MSQEPRKINLSDLHLWTENPRDPVNADYTDKQVIERAILECSHKWNLDKMLDDMGIRYDMSELPTVVIEKGKNVVYDGNRRIATLKCIQNLSLYQAVTGNLHWAKNLPKELLELSEVYCNVCDKDTALDNIERKHISNGSWSVLERDYFRHNFRKQPKSDFIIFEEATNLITKNEKILNQRFVQEEVFTKENLNKIGLDIRNEQLISNANVDSAKLLQELVTVISENFITTRKNRKNLLGAIREHNPNYAKTLRPFDPKSKNIEILLPKTITGQPSLKRSAVKKPTNVLFGGVLCLRGKKTPEIYTAIEHIYNDYKKNPDKKWWLLPIIAFSLRLLIETVAQEYYNSQNPPVDKGDKALEQFLSSIVKPYFKNVEKQKLKTQYALISEWINGELKLEAVLSKWAHGTLAADNDTIIRHSRLIAEIIKQFWWKNN
jgi:hypothetical protein